MPVKILLADDHTVMREGLRMLLEAQPDMVVVGEAANGRDAVRQCQLQCPDVLVMDISMPDLNGVEAAQQIGERCPSTKVIMLSMHASEEYVARSFQAGAIGYVIKEAAGLEVISAIRSACAGQPYLSRKLSAPSVRQYADRRSGPSPLEQLSAREREVLQLTVEGKPSTKIASILGLSPKTVDTYRSRLMRKLGVNDLPHLVKFAIQHGLTSLES